MLQNSKFFLMHRNYIDYDMHEIGYKGGMHMIIAGTRRRSMIINTFCVVYHYVTRLAIRDDVCSVSPKICTADFV